MAFRATARFIRMYATHIDTRGEVAGKEILEVLYARAIEPQMLQRFSRRQAIPRIGLHNISEEADILFAELNCKR